MRFKFGGGGESVGNWWFKDALYPVELKDEWHSMRKTKRERGEHGPCSYIFYSLILNSSGQKLNFRP